jgi:hypothetical protein
VFAPKFPKEFSVALRCEEYSTVSTSTIQRMIVPLFEFLGRNPANLVQMYNMYEFAKITAITFHIDLATSTTTPFLIVGGVLPYSASSTVAPSDLAGQADSKARLASVFQKTRISWTLPAEKYLGNVLQSSQFWINKAQSLSSTPVSVEEPTFVLVTQHPTGATMDYIYQTVITYHCQFFEPLVNNISTQEFEKVPERRSKHDTERSCSEPKLNKDLDRSQFTELLKIFEARH